MDIGDWIAIIISLFSLLFSFYVYNKHDKKIKNLERKKLEREILESTRAEFDVHFEWLFTHHILSLHNIGKSTAKNIVIYIESDTPILFQNGTSQFKINQLEVTEKTSIHLACNFTKTVKVTLIWDDESGKGITDHKYLESECGNDFIGK